MSQSEFERHCALFNYTPKGRFLDTKEYAALRGISIRTAEDERVRGVGPRFIQPKGTRRVLYAEPEVLAWLASGLKHSTSEAA